MRKYKKCQVFKYTKEEATMSSKYPSTYLEATLWEGNINDLPFFHMMLVFLARINTKLKLGLADRYIEKLSFILSQLLVDPIEDDYSKPLNYKKLKELKQGRDWLQCDICGYAYLIDNLIGITRCGKQYAICPKCYHDTLVRIEFEINRLWEELEQLKQIKPLK